MKKLRINSFISMYEKPVLGSVEGEIRFMAISVDKSTLNHENKRGLAREITKSKGNVDIPGFIDESKLILVESKDLLKWKKVKDLKINKINKIIEKLPTKDEYFIGLEDPDIWTDEKGIKHVYFTIAYKLKKNSGYHIYLGHAQGETLDSLVATPPVLSPQGEKIRGFKEVAISPIQTKKGRFNLNEIGYYDKGDTSMISSSIANEAGEPWDYQKIVLDPKKMKYLWIKGHASPCSLLSESFIKIGSRLVGIVNGREPEKLINGRKVYGRFRPGLVLFNPKTGEIPWVDSQPLLEDPDASTITFASDFVQISKTKGILYCHVNDSFVRAYEIDAEGLKKYLSERFEL